MIILTDDETTYLHDLAVKRHDAKHVSFRNSGKIGNNAKSFEGKSEYLPHFLGLVGEYVWAKHVGKNIDENIYSRGDKKPDVGNVEVKTITYFGTGEPELKITEKEYNERKAPKKYALIRYNKETNEAEILGTITRYMFDKKKKKKKYGRNLPTNYTVPVSEMRKVKNEH